MMFEEKPKRKRQPGDAEQQRRVILMFLTLLIVGLGIFVALLSPSPQIRQFELTTTSIVATNQHVMTDIAATGPPPRMNCPYNPLYLDDDGAELARLREAGLDIVAFTAELPCGSSFPNIERLTLILPVETIDNRQLLGQTARDALRALTDREYAGGTYTVSLVFAAVDGQVALWHLPLFEAAALTRSDVGTESLFEMLQALAAQ